MKRIEIPAHNGARRAMKARLAAFNYTDLSVSDVGTRIKRALLTLMVQPDKEANWLRVKSNCPEHIREKLAPEDEQFVRNEELSRQKRFDPTPQDVARYVDDLAWLNPLSEAEQDIIFWRAKDHSYRDIAEWISGNTNKQMTERGARYAYKSAISNCWLAASIAKEHSIAEQNSQGQRAPGPGRRRA